MYPFRENVEDLRLESQAALLRPYTIRSFQESGLLEGDRVLELGSGGGHLTLLIAKIVGDDGKIHGIDSSLAAIRRARRRAKLGNVGNTQFICAKAGEFFPSGDYDAVVGRFILAYIRSPEKLIEGISMMACARRMIFQEWWHRGIPPTFPPKETVDRVHELIVKALQWVGIDMEAGARLPLILGSVPAWEVVSIRNETPCTTTSAVQWLEYLAATGHGLVDVMCEAGLLQSASEWEVAVKEARHHVRGTDVLLTLSQLVTVVARRRL